MIQLQEYNPYKATAAMLSASRGLTPVLEVLMQDYTTLPLFSLQEETKEIPLTQGKFAIVDAADYEWLSQSKWQAHRSRAGWYARRCVLIEGKKQNIYMHREICVGAPSVDHIDGDGLNNTRSNLRQSTASTNSFNRAAQANNSSGYKGVHWYKALCKWQAQIKSGGIRRHLGFFTSAEDAARAYDVAAKKLHGEFAHTNFPGE